jgi:hypothetical protein
MGIGVRIPFLVCEVMVRREVDCRWKLMYDGVQIRRPGSHPTPTPPRC